MSKLLQMVKYGVVKDFDWHCNCLSINFYLAFASKVKILKHKKFCITINRLWQEDMVTFNKDENLWSVQILIKALTTRQNADRQYY